MSKWITVFLSVYLLLLALLPCGDRLECNDTENDSISLSQTEHDDHQHETETCSPFCICTCCGQILNIPGLTFFNLKVFSDPTQPLPVFNETEMSEPDYAIWQPPKMISC